MIPFTGYCRYIGGLQALTIVPVGQRWLAPFAARGQNRSLLELPTRVIEASAQWNFCINTGSSGRVLLPEAHCGSGEYVCLTVPHHSQLFRDGGTFGASVAF